MPLKRVRWIYPSPVQRIWAESLTPPPAVLYTYGPPWYCLPVSAFFYLAKTTSGHKMQFLISPACDWKESMRKVPCRLSVVKAVTRKDVPEIKSFKDNTVLFRHRELELEL